jgi:UDP-3-O-[3-hydroxymyristoyl] glucosamine N-acyltransferase
MNTMPGFKISEILPHFSDCRFIGDATAFITGAIPLPGQDNGNHSSSICWISDKNIDSFTVPSSFSLGLFILSEKGYERFKECECNFLVSVSPRATFTKLLSLKFAMKRKPMIEPTCVVSAGSLTGKNCYLGHHVVIEPNVIIGDDVEIMHNTVIMEGTRIGNGVKIGSNCTIGNYGFGYELNDEGQYTVLHHLGNVILEDAVEVGNNTAIDRAVLGSTLIKKNAKIDNLVHIAHGVEIGENSLIIANSMIAGSVTIGKNVWVAPSSSVLNKKRVQDNAVIGMGAVVIRDVTDGDIVAGNPARSIKKT